MAAFHSHHDHAPAHAARDAGDFGLAFAIGTALNLALVIGELGFGFWANSLALMSDGVHNFSDVIGLVLAWGMAGLARRQPTALRTYGFRRAPILAALGNAALLFVGTGAILVEALRRFFIAAPVATATTFWVAILAIVVNAGTALLFARGRRQDVNIQGVFLHMVGDAAVSFGVAVAAVLIAWTGWLWIDPAVSAAIAVVIAVATWGLTREALNLALDAVPRGIDRHAVEAYLAGLPGVAEVHDLHIWALSTTETALTAHIVRPGSGLDDKLLADAAHELEHRFGIRHATIQMEAGVLECRLAPTDEV